MFIGECLCLLPVLYTHWSSNTARKQNSVRYESLPQDEEEEEEETRPPRVTTRTSAKLPLLFFLPAFCDICGTTLMNVGLLFTPVSIYQMTRGALVLWVGIFSVLFLRRRLEIYQWFMLVCVMLGVCVVGLSGTILKEVDGVAKSQNAVGNGTDEGTDTDVPPAVTALLGVVLILFAQLFTASQFVLEEKVSKRRRGWWFSVVVVLHWQLTHTRPQIMARYEIEPLLAVGYEGLWGLLTVLISMPILHFFIGSTTQGRGGYFDMYTGFHQMISNTTILWTSVAIALSISLFNGCGLAVTRAISATARSTIDTCRTLGIWIVSLLLGWEVLRPLSGSLQTLGFALLVYGTLVFNGIVRPPGLLTPREQHQDDDGTERALPTQPTQVQAAQAPLVDVHQER